MLFPIKINDIRKKEKETIENFKKINDYKKDEYDYFKENEETKNEIKNYKNIVNNNLNLSNKSIQTEFNIDINEIKEMNEKNIIELMNKINDNNLTEYQKRNIILLLDKSIKNDKRIEKRKYWIELQKIKKEYNEKYFNKNKKNSNNDDNSYEELERIKKKIKTTEIKLENKNKLKNISLDNLINNNSHNDNYNYNNSISNNDYNYNNLNSYSEDQSTREESKINYSKNEGEEEEKQKNKKAFNEIRAGFYIKNKIFDEILYKGGDENNKIIGEIYKIDDKHFGLLYTDDYITNSITKSTYMNNRKNEEELTEEEKKDKIFDDKVGLYFCYSDIQLEKEIKKCEPNNFICKKCMEINKKLYNIKSDYLINIKGRVSKINKGSYHCFGHYLSGYPSNQIEDCINKFSCKACQTLDKYFKYYK